MRTGKGAWEGVGTNHGEVRGGHCHSSQRVQNINMLKAAVYNEKTVNVHQVCQQEVTGDENDSSLGNEPDFRFQ